MADASTIIAGNFSYAAKEYADHATLQHQVRHSLWEKISAIASVEGMIADIGSGPGLLAQEQPHLPIFSLDLAEGMAKQASQHGPALVADMGALPLQDDSCELVFSSLALQWASSPAAFFAEAARITKPAGWLAVATLLPGSFQELRTALKKVGLASRLLSPPPLAQLCSAAQSYHWQIHAQEEETLQTTHKSVIDLLRSFKQLGAHGSHQPGRTLRNKQDLTQLEAHYPNRQPDDALQASWQIAFILAQKSA